MHFASLIKKNALNSHVWHLWPGHFACKGGFLALFLLFMIAMAARAELMPEEVAIIAMENNENSKALAEHYTQARGIPPSHILFLSAKPQEEISRGSWEEEYRPALLSWLKENDPDKKLRCLVTTWDVPLRIAKRKSTSRTAVARAEFLADSRKRRMEQFNGVLKSLEELAGGTGREFRPLPASASIRELAKRLDPALSAAKQHLSRITSPDDRKTAGRALERLFVMAGGSGAALRMAAARADLSNLSPEQALRLGKAGGRIEGFQQALRALGSLPDSVARDVQMLNLVQANTGLVGSIQWIDQQQELLEKNETYSSFDSELSLIYWPDYPLFRWYPNLLSYKYDGAGIDPKRQMMVARLTAPTLDLAKGLVDKALAVEKTGLKGKVYLDARGFTPDTGEGKVSYYGQYDQSLRDLAARLKQHTSLEVVLNSQSSLFAVGECPDAALYCGWSSPENYVDAFGWQPGAVGYHLGGSEAAPLQKPGSPAWCAAMLEDGITATLGAVYEPYLQAFPLPDLFFSTLLTGKYTLAETYYRTKPFNSWAMVLVGDPLYNPYKNNPLLHEDNLPDELNPKKRAEAAAAARRKPQEEEASPPVEQPPAEEPEPESPEEALPQLPGINNE